MTHDQIKAIEEELNNILFKHLSQSCNEFCYKEIIKEFRSKLIALLEADVERLEGEMHKLGQSELDIREEAKAGFNTAIHAEIAHRRAIIQLLKESS